MILIFFLFLNPEIINQTHLPPYLDIDKHQRVKNVLFPIYLLYDITKNYNLHNMAQME